MKIVSTFALIFTLILSSVVFANLGNQKQDIKFELQWGGYYISKNEDGKFGVFRILDFNIDAYHVALFSEEFDKEPDMEVILKLEPFIGHAPIDSKALLNKNDLRLIGSRKLTKDDLVGYRYYLTGGEDEDEEIGKFINNVIDFSSKPSMKLLLSVSEGKLEIKEQE